MSRFALFHGKKDDAANEFIKRASNGDFSSEVVKGLLRHSNEVLGALVNHATQGSEEEAKAIRRLAESEPKLFIKNFHLTSEMVKSIFSEGGNPEAKKHLLDALGWIGPYAIYAALRQREGNSWSTTTFSVLFERVVLHHPKEGAEALAQLLKPTNHAVEVPTADLRLACECIHHIGRQLLFLRLDDEREKPILTALEFFLSPQQWSDAKREAITALGNADWESNPRVRKLVLKQLRSQHTARAAAETLFRKGEVEVLSKAIAKPALGHITLEHMNTWWEVAQVLRGRKDEKGVIRSEILYGIMEAAFSCDIETDKGKQILSEAAKLLKPYPEAVVDFIISTSGNEENQAALLAALGKETLALLPKRLRFKWDELHREGKTPHIEPLFSAISDEFKAKELKPIAKEMAEMLRQGFLAPDLVASTENDYTSFIIAAALGGLGQPAVKPLMEALAKAPDNRRGAFTIAFAFMRDSVTLMPTKDYLSEIIDEACKPHDEDLSEAYANAIANAGELGMQLLRAKYEVADAAGKGRVLDVVMKAGEKKPGIIKSFAAINELIEFVLSSGTSWAIDSYRWPALCKFVGIAAAADPSLAHVQTLQKGLQQAFGTQKRTVYLAAIGAIAEKNKRAPELVPLIPTFIRLLEGTLPGENSEDSKTVAAVLKCCGPNAVLPLLEFYRKHPDKAKTVLEIVEAIKGPVENGVVSSADRPEDLKLILSAYLQREAGAPA